MSNWFRKENNNNIIEKSAKELNNVDVIVEEQPQYNSFMVYRNGTYAGLFTCFIDRAFKLCCYVGDERRIYTTTVEKMFKRGGSYEIHTCSGSSYILVQQGPLAEIRGLEIASDAFTFTIIEGIKLKGHGKACVTANFRLHYVIDDTMEFCYTEPITSIVLNAEEREIRVRAGFRVITLGF